MATGFLAQQLRRSLIQGGRQMPPLGMIRLGMRRKAAAGGLFSGIAKLASKALPALRVIPGVGNVLSAVSLGASAVGAVKSLRGAIPASRALVPLGQAAGRQLPGLGKLALGAGAAGLGAAALTGALTGERTRKRYRRTNYSNFRALKRACRRVKGFEKMARECVTLSKRVRVKKGKRCR